VTLTRAVITQNRMKLEHFPVKKIYFIRRSYKTTFCRRLVTDCKQGMDESNPKMFHLQKFNFQVNGEGKDSFGSGCNYKRKGHLI
jgi:hypothetical protein